MNEKKRWENVYSIKDATAVSWYQPRLEVSVAFIQEANLAKDAHIVDAGGGASTLVDDLLDLGYTNITVIDLAASALLEAKKRLGVRAADVTWIAGDVTTTLLDANSVDFWHDRAVFHFLTDPQDQQRYVQEVLRTLKPAARVLVATFGLDGPLTCSGLPVVRYDDDGIHQTFGRSFIKIGSQSETHVTPAGKTQSFTYCFCRRQ